ncbi:MAG: hypothetical protein TR69_WS6001000137 [candidate division WS6 bacterium OLB20]|uniref:Uncharacterized protein n=1 Tax=candidate division WS6 bacterium OLB20 TaxID=1617426 RepID=A0A136M043_9BACT|nr:MAG: hypothetical protein TR69_WS6001000137 [candidate division WS6 bacterium OLB20]
MKDGPFSKFVGAVKHQAAKVSTAGLHPRYMWDASSERIRYWMLNSIFPENTRGHNLHKAIDHALENGEFIMQIGCGRHGQALLDLKKLGAGNLIGMDFRVPAEDYEDIAFVAADLTKRLPVEDDTFTGLVFGSYHFHYMSPGEQLHLLTEIDRITGPGSLGFLGPFFPQHLLEGPFADAFSDYKNPVYGFVKSRSVGGQRWRLYRSRIASLSTFSGIKTSSRTRKGVRIPLLSFYDMGFRSLTGRMLGNARIKRDYRPIIPNEYFITFEK